MSDVLPDVERLRTGHATVGRWTLGQICQHLAGSFHGSIDGFDLSRHRVKRALIRKPMLWYTFRYGIPESYTVDPGIEPTEPLAVDDGIAALANAIRRYESHTGPLQAHPLFGRMSRRNWDRIHRIHCAHHLSFVIPTFDRP